MKEQSQPERILVYALLTITVISLAIVSYGILKL